MAHNEKESQPIIKRECRGSGFEGGGKGSERGAAVWTREENHGK